MKKVLIYMAKNTLKPTGGPRGYLYNLYRGLGIVENNDVSIEFLPDSKKERYHKYFNKMPKVLRKRYIDYTMRKRCNRIINHPEQCVCDIDFSQYDAIHFHNVFTLASIRNSLESYKGKILLTNHSPKPMFQEWIEDTISESEYIRHQSLYDALKEIEREMYDRADVIIFPCQEAEEPCYNNWKDYLDVKRRNADKYKYMLTGVTEAKIARTRKELCERFGIPETAFIISYVGRHNITKGYDNLKKIGDRILKMHENVYFLIAGKEEPLTGLENSHWIEAGWINDPGSFYAAADIFILPNKETYFDLVMLEALSVGSIVVASRTGGNKYFDKLGCKSVLLYDTLEDAVDIIEEILDSSHSEIESMHNSSKEVYNEYFGIEKFARNYIDLIKEVI